MSTKEAKSTESLESALVNLSGSIPKMVIEESLPSLLDVSKDLYKYWKNGNMPVFCENTEDLRLFYNERKRDIALNLIAFLHMASNAVLNKDKLEGSSVRDISSAILSAVKILESLTGETPVVKHKHEHKHAAVSKEELDEEMQRVREQLRVVDAQFK